LASIYNFSYALLVVKNKFKIAIRLAYDKILMKEIWVISWPFAAYGIFQRLYTYLDSVLLSIFAGDAQVGLYQIAFKIIFALQFLPSAFTASLYPAMSSYWHNNREQLLVSFERSINYLIIISLPIIVGSIVLADKIILLFKAGYSEALLPLEISIVSLFFIFINFPIGSLLNACDKQRKNTLNMGIVMVASIVMNLILIPQFKAVGASITVLATNILMFVLGIYWVKKIIPYHYGKNLKIFAKVLLSSVVMGIIIFWGKTYLNVFIATIIGAMIYFVLLLILGGFKKDDLTSILQSFKR
jgi:O-antigen/teichoic acid export membrane protein